MTPEEIGEVLGLEAETVSLMFEIGALTAEETSDVDSVRAWLDDDNQLFVEVIRSLESMTGEELRTFQKVMNAEQERRRAEAASRPATRWRPSWPLRASGAGDWHRGSASAGRRSRRPLYGV